MRTRHLSALFALIAMILLALLPASAQQPIQELLLQPGQVARIACAGDQVLIGQQDATHAAVSCQQLAATATPTATATAMPTSTPAPTATAMPTATPTTAPQILLPKAIALDQPELVNPGRGFITWGGGSNTIPLPEPSRDWTKRYSWSDIETSEGVYNWSVVDTDLARAAAAGQRMGVAFRDMRSTGRNFPAYLLPHSWSTVDTSTGSTIVVPDYNHATYQAAQKRFLQAAGARYGRDPRVSFLDIRMFGKWGEWHLYGIDYSKAPSGIVPATEATRRAIIDMHIAAFPEKQLVVLIADSYALHYTMQVVKSPTIGWRADSFGKGTYLQSALAKRLDDYPGLEAAFLARWQIAPVIAELYGSDVTAAALLEQVKLYRPDVIGNGNFGDAWATATAADQALFREAGKRAGYRLQINRVEVGQRDDMLQLVTTWQNVGATPLREVFTARFELRNATGQVVWKSASVAPLRGLMPGAPHVISDAFARPALQPGSYALHVLVTSSDGTRTKPLQLAIDGKQADSSYQLGQVGVR